MRECSGGKPERAAKAMLGIPRGRRRSTGPKARLTSIRGAEAERMCWDPKDGELCPGRVKPEETLVEARSDSDVQIDRQIWV